MPGSFLPYGRQTVTEADIAAVVDVLRSGWLTSGPAVERFETALSVAVGARYAVACASGTAALHLAMLAAGIGQGDLVIVPAVTFSATANAARYVGATPVFADVDPYTGLMEPVHVEAALQECQGRVSAVVPVHLAGQCADLAGISAIAHRVGAVVIEDACHALGTRYTTNDGSSHAVGGANHASLACFSFHPVKTIAMGEGGAVTTNDAVLARRLTELRNHGITQDPSAFVARALAFDATGEANPWYYEVQSLGFNYRASDLHCALGTSQLARLGKLIARRRKLVSLYDKQLSCLAPLVRPVHRKKECDAAWHLMSVLIDFDVAARNRATVMKALKVTGIGTQVHYIPVPWHPLYSNENSGKYWAGAKRYYMRVLSLPLFPSMQDEDVDRVVGSLGEALGVA